MKSTVIFALIVAATPSFAVPPKNIACRFQTLSTVKHDAVSNPTTIPIERSVKIVNGKTDPATLQLPFGKRATSSEAWTAVPEVIFTVDTTMVGDRGDVLIVNHPRKETSEPLRGVHAASLVYTYEAATYISLGTCTTS